MKAALTLLLLSITLFVQLMPAAETSQDEKDILATLAVWRQAALKGDAAALDKLFHPDLTYSHNNAKIENKAQAIAGAVSPETKSKGVEYYDLVTHVYGNTAVMTGRCVITTSADHVNNMHVLMVWLKGPQGWQIVARHSVKLPDLPSPNSK